MPVMCLAVRARAPHLQDMRPIAVKKCLKRRQGARQGLTRAGALLAVALPLLGLVPSAGLAQSGPAAVNAALEAVAARDWAEARRLAGQAGPSGAALMQDLVEWHRLRRADSNAAFGDYVAFLGRNGDWPGLPYMRRQGEAAIPPAASPQDVFAFFDGAEAQTGAGAVRLIEAHLAQSEQDTAEALIVDTWRSKALGRVDRESLLERFPDILAPHHTARLDAMLWQGQEKEARAMFALVPPAWQALAEARLALRAERDGVDTLIRAVPAALSDDPGLAYERFRWRVSKGRADAALALLEERSGSAETLGRPELWAERRRFYARDLMRDGALSRAYSVAARHGLTTGRNYADLEWLSGYLALRLDRPGDAVEHFKRFGAAVDTPISLGRAGYWLGRAYMAAGDAANARLAWQEGARYQTSFYGLLAAEALGAPLDPAMAGGERFGPLEQASFAGSTVLATGLVLYEAGEMFLSERFLTHLTEQKSRAEAGILAELALTLQDPHLALRIAKRAASDGHVLPDAYYPLSPIADGPLPVPSELALAIARRESEFDPGVVSPVGARGLMQLMPGTAREMAAGLGRPYDPDALLSDPAYNLELGAAYLAELVERYNGSPVLIAAAYNAGPSRADRWISRFGDPRNPSVDVIAWIENIPFRETRNYIMRVTESMPVYAARQGRLSSAPLAFRAFLQGRSAAFAGARATE